MNFNDTAPLPILDLIHEYRLDMELWDRMVRIVDGINERYPKQTAWRIPNALSFLRGLTEEHWRYAVSKGALWGVSE